YEDASRGCLLPTSNGPAGGHDTESPSEARTSQPIRHLAVSSGTSRGCHLMPTFEKSGARHSIGRQPWATAFQSVDQVQSRSPHFSPRVSTPNEPVSPRAISEKHLEFIDRLDQVPDVLSGILQIPRDFPDCRDRLLGQPVSRFLPQVRRRGPCGPFLRHNPIPSDECPPDIASGIFSRNAQNRPAGRGDSLSKGRWPLAISIRRPPIMSATC